MFGSLYFRGCKYTNKILFINKNIVFQHFVLLITCHLERFPVKPGMTKRGRSGMTREPFPVISTGFLSVISTERSEWRDLHSRRSSQKNTMPSLPKRNDRPSDNFLGKFMSDGAENGGKTPKNGTVHHVFRHFDVGRSELQHFPEEIYTG